MTHVSLMLICAGLYWPGVTSTPDAPRVAYGESADFWDSYALVVAIVDDPDRARFRVEQSIPPRYRKGVVFAWRDRGIVTPHLDRWADKSFPKLFQMGDRILCMVKDVGGTIELKHAAPLQMPEGVLQLPAEGDYGVFAMLPDQPYGGESGDKVVAATLRLCDALAERDPATKLKKVDAVLRDKPSERDRDLLRRSLAASIGEWDRALKNARHLVK